MNTIAHSYWPATNDGALLETSCGDVLRQAASIAPLHTALVSGHPDPAMRIRRTYRDLLAAAEQIALTLLERFAPGTHVAVWGENALEWVYVQLGVALAGMVLVTVNPACQPHELSYILRQSAARVLFHQSEYRGTSMSSLFEAASLLETLQTDWIIGLDDVGHMLSAKRPSGELPQVSPYDIAMIQYTSGTTGKPKGAMLSHRSVTNTSRIMALIKGQGADTVSLLAAPLFHTAGCVSGVLSSIQMMGTLVLMSSFNADLMLDLIEQEHATFTFGVPTMLIALMQAQEERQRDVSSLRTVFSGGTIVPISVVRNVELAFGVTLIIGYGLTECSPAITHTRLTDSLEDKSETVGPAIPFVEVKIVDPVTRKMQPVGEPGELCARGFNVMRGYYDMPEATAAAIDSDGWFLTGDLCTMDGRGYVRVTGRLKDVIIRGGENIYPREIEDLLFALPAVNAAVVIPVPDAYWGEQVAAILTLRKGDQPDAAFFSAYLQARLARHKVPRHWFIVDSIPMNAAGKVQKSELIKMVAAGALDRFKL